MAALCGAAALRPMRSDSNSSGKIQCNDHDLADLDADIERRQRRHERILSAARISRQRAGKAEAVNKPEETNVTRPAAVDVVTRRKKFSAATNMIDAAIRRFDSDCRGDRKKICSAASDSVIEWAMVKAVTTLTKGHKRWPQKITASKNAMWS